MTRFQPIDYLRITGFILTFILVLYGLTKGFDMIEYSINLIYFTIIIVILIYDNKKIFIRIFRF